MLLTASALPQEPTEKQILAPDSEDLISTAGFGFPGFPLQLKSQGQKGREVCGRAVIAPNM